MDDDFNNPDAGANGMISSGLVTDEYKGTRDRARSLPSLREQRQEWNAVSHTKDMFLSSKNCMKHIVTLILSCDGLARMPALRLCDMNLAKQ